MQSFSGFLFILSSERTSLEKQKFNCSTKLCYDENSLLHSNIAITLMKGQKMAI
jgi:hypothetical protein